MLFERLLDNSSGRWLVLPGLLVLVLWLALDHAPPSTFSDILDDKWSRMLGASDLGRYQPGKMLRGACKSSSCGNLFVYG